MAYGLAPIVILLDNDAADSTLLAGADTFFNAIGGAGSSNALQLRYTGELPLFPSIAICSFFLRHFADSTASAFRRAHRAVCINAATGIR